MLSKEIEAVCEKDQLNVYSLEASARSSIMKEKRELIGEIRLKRPAPAWTPHPKVKPDGEDPEGIARGERTGVGAEAPP